MTKKDIIRSHVAIPASIKNNRLENKVVELDTYRLKGTTGTDHFTFENVTFNGTFFVENFPKISAKDCEINKALSFSMEKF